MAIVRRYAGPGILLLFGWGIDLSGFQNIYLSAALWLGAGIWAIVATLTWEPVSRGFRLSWRLSFGIGSVIALVIFLVWLVKQPVQQVNHETSQRNAILEWATGSPGTNTLHVVIDTGALMQYRGNYTLLVMVRVQDDSVDARDDPRVEKSSSFALTGEIRRIELRPTQEFMRRLLPRGVVQFYVLLMPTNTNIAEIETVNQSLQVGGILLGSRAMLVQTRLSG